MLTLNDGRNELWQWDTGRKLTVDADCSQVHFGRNVYGRSIDVDVVDGVAIIPDILLQTDKDLTAWAFVGTAENGYTKISKVFKVNKRNKPAGYVFTPQDQSTLGEILDRIEDLENRPSGDISEEDIQNAVKDYLDKNPVSFEEKDPTVPDWAKQSNPPSVDIPKTLPNPHKLTFTGAVTAEYDGSEPVEVKIPEGGSGGGSDEWKKVTTIQFATDVLSYELDISAYSELFILTTKASDFSAGQLQFGDNAIYNFNLFKTANNGMHIIINKNKWVCSICQRGSDVLAQIHTLACGNTDTLIFVVGSMTSPGAIDVYGR